MNSNGFHSSAWYNAITLRERAPLLSLDAPASRPRSSDDGARARVHRWQQQAPFSQGEYFHQRLQLAGLTPAQLLDVVEMHPEAIKDRLSEPPRWLDILAAAFGEPRNTDGDTTVADQSVATLVDPLEPLICYAAERLAAATRLLVEKYAFAPFDERTADPVLREDLTQRLAEMVGRTLVLELHVARLSDMLYGDTPEARFQNFLNLLREPGRTQALLREYPVLARQLASAVDTWITFSVELLERLCVDWPDIIHTLAQGEEPGRLVACGVTGDTHAGGRHVVVLEFDSGFRVVYKPRSLSLDCHFQQLLGWLNERGQNPPLRPLRIVDRHDYGWVEYVAGRGCDSEAELQRFYERQGSNLAILYVLNATDFHNENVIASGEHPVLIDLETLFHQSPANRQNALAWNAMTGSVLGVGLLPQHSWFSEESDGIDLSGLGSVAGQLSPFTVPQFEAIGTDQMRWTRKHMRFGAEKNQPILNDQLVDVRNYVGSIEAGFTATYRLLLDHRGELVSDDGPLAACAADELRIVLRPTQTYASLLRESFHPDVLRDALDRDRFFDRLWMSIEAKPHLGAVIGAEIDDLQNGDIPIFRTRPGSIHLWTSHGQRLTAFFKETGLDVVKRRLSQLGSIDLDRQLWFIRASFATLATSPEGAPIRQVQIGQAPAMATVGELLRAARAVADRLNALAIRSNDEATWVGLSSGPRRRVTIAPLLSDLYDGLPGVVLFLAYAGSILDDDDYTSLAREGLANLRRQVELQRTVLTAIGAFSGWGGVAYTLDSLGSLWNEPRLHTEAAEVLELIVPLIERDDQLDIIGGAAGCLASVIGLQCGTPERRSAIAIRCGDHLMAQSRRLSRGVGWRAPGQPKPLAGFSHGAAGIGWALLKVWDATGDERYRETALDAIRYERSLFSPADGNWRDLRARESRGEPEVDGSAPFMTAWCHGAPGIALARLLSLGQLADDGLEAEARIALQTTLDRGLGLNHSLCHGDLGNLEVLFIASQLLEDGDLHSTVYTSAAAVIGDINRNGWRCGVPAGAESPGLMTGLAGIGYQFLRLANPERVPSVLVLEPPVSA